MSVVVSVAAVITTATDPTHGDALLWLAISEHTVHVAAFELQLALNCKVVHSENGTKRTRHDLARFVGARCRHSMP